jgi:hypothetical protein
LQLPHFVEEIIDILPVIAQAVFVGSATTGSGTPVLGTLVYWHCNYLIL